MTVFTYAGDLDRFDLILATRTVTVVAGEPVEFTDDEVPTLGPEWIGPRESPDDDAPGAPITDAAKRRRRKTEATAVADDTADTATTQPADEAKEVD